MAEGGSGKASRMLDELMQEGVGQAEPTAALPVLPRVRLVLPSGPAPLSVRKRLAADKAAAPKPVSQLLPEILKEVDEARRAAASKAAAAPAPAAPPPSAQPEPSAQPVPRRTSRIARRFQLTFGKPSTLAWRPRSRMLATAEGLDDKAIYSFQEDKPLRVPDTWWSKPGLVGWLFLAPALATFLLFSWLPMLRGLLLSFSKVGLSGPSEWVGLANYLRAASDPQVWATLGHAVAFCLLSLAAGFWVPIALAIYTNETRRAQGLLRFLFFLPFLTPTVPAVMVWRWILDQGYGLLNSLISYLPFVEDPHVPWLNHRWLAMLSVVLVFLWKNTGWNTLIYLTNLSEVPEELYETAELDGAPFWSRVRHISLPALSGAMRLLLLMQVINTFQIFTEVFLLTGGGPANSTEMIATYMYKKSFLYLDLGYAAALAVMLFLFLVSFTSLRRRAAGEEL